MANNTLASWVGSFDWLMPQCTTRVAENGVLSKELARPAAVWLRSTWGWSREPADTVGGWLIAHLGRLPKRGESNVIEGLRFQVLRADSRRVYTLLVDKPKS